MLVNSKLDLTSVSRHMPEKHASSIEERQCRLTWFAESVTGMRGEAQKI